ncbi:MAG: DUF4178 domain-containing protein, partial [Ramlibacter sp.]
GEFYWPVERGHTTFNRDYAKGRALLSMEETPREVTWSVGTRIAADIVVKAFGLEARRDAVHHGDAGPTSNKGGGTGCGCATVLLMLLVILIFIALLKACDDEWSSSGGSGGYYRGSGGGYSSHK